MAAFLVFGIYQGVTAESYIDADEIYYAYYMKHIPARGAKKAATGYGISATSYSHAGDTEARQQRRIEQ